MDNVIELFKYIIIIIILISPCILRIIFYNNNNNNNNNINDINKSPILNQQQCYETKYINCSNINGSYNQCTNNFKHNMKCQCDQNSYNLDVCDPLNENIKQLNNNKFFKPKTCIPRVNMYNPNITCHDKLK